MKKLYSMLLMLFCVLSASALPEELYLVGNFNNWSTPDTGKDLYILKPTGTEGTYSGTFNIPAPAENSNLEFKVLTTKTNNLEEAYGAWDTKNGLLSLFSDNNRDIELLRRCEPVYVTNWKGGKLTLTCTFTESTDSAMKMTLITPDQPETPPYPENIWVIGDFNNWAIPSASTDNGAIRMTTKKTELGHYEIINAAIPSGKAHFAYYYVDPVDNTDKFFVADDLMELTGLYRISEAQKGVYWSCASPNPDIFENISEAQAKATNILNYTGPDLDFGIFWRLDRSLPYKIWFNWDNAPLNDLNNLYLYIENIDTDEKFLVLPNTEEEWSILWQFFIKGNIRIWLTESNTLPIEKKWGIYSNPNDSWITMRNYCVPDGKPITINTGDSYKKIRLYFDKSTHQIGAEHSNAEYYDAEKLYVIGYLDGWSTPIESNASRFQTLEKVSDGVYEGVVNFPRPSGTFTDPQFRLHYKLDNWDNPGSIGSWYDENTPKEISFEDSKYSSVIFANYKGNWRLPEWENDGDVRIHVDFNDMTMSLTNLSTNSVKGIESENMNAPVFYFNLQGQRVSNPSNGIFIRVQGSKSEKVILN